LYHANCPSSSMAWFGYDQGVFSGVLISADFKYHFPETNDPNISGITSSCFAVSCICPASFDNPHKLTLLTAWCLLWCSCSFHVW
jgi:hypothetical protein